MPPSDILEVIEGELNLREKAVLNEMVVKQLQEELEKKSDALLNKMIEANKRQQELERMQMRIKSMESPSAKADAEPAQPKTTKSNAEAKTTRAATRYALIFVNLNSSQSLHVYFSTDPSPRPP